MPDGTSRYSKDGKTIYHFMGCSTFSEYSVIAEISAAKINKAADLNKVCVLGCGVSTGWGAAMNNTTVTPGSTVAVWGLGAVGLAVIQAAKFQKAGKIYGLDTNPSKFDIAKKFGADECFNPKDGNAKDWLISKEKWGIEFTYDCTGNVNVMRDALEASHRGFGQSCVIGVAEAGKELATRPFQLVTGRHWLGTAFGGWKSRTDVPKLVNKSLLNEMPIDDFITHPVDSLENVNKAIDALHSGDCLRAVVKIAKGPEIPDKQPKVVSSNRHWGGVLKTVKHWSEATKCEMTFNIFLPEDVISKQRGQDYPVLYYLSGLTCNQDTPVHKTGFGRYAKKYNVAMVFPDTSPRVDNVEGQNDKDFLGTNASFYVDATNGQWKENYQMYTYITKDLVECVQSYFPVSKTRQSIMGHSMGGHGAITIGLKNSDKYQSISALAPISNPTKSEWGIEQFTAYLGSVDAGKQYDATEIMKSYQGKHLPLLINVGTSDQFAHRLHIQEFLEAADKSNYKVIHKANEYYDHSQFFVATFIKDHIKFHAQSLNAFQ